MSSGGHPLFGFVPPTSLSGGTGPTTTIASLLWGPDFGDPPSGTWGVAGTVSADVSYAFGDNLGAFAAVDLWSITQVTNAATQIALSGTFSDLLYELLGANAILSGEIETPYDAAATAAVDLYAVDQSYDAASSAGFDLTEMELFGDHNVSVGQNSYIYDVFNMFSQEDTWLDEDNGGTAHGADTVLQCRQANALGNAAQNAYVAWDLTSFPDGSPVSGEENIFTFDVRRSTGLVNANLNFQVYVSASKPFEEDTATWDNTEPPPGVQIDSGSFDNLGTSFGTEQYTLNEADIQSALGSWVYFRFIGETGLGNTTEFEIRSKEFSASLAPKLNIAREVSL